MKHLYFKLSFLALLLIAAGVVAIRYTQLKNLSEREKYEAYLRQHPYSQKPAIPKGGLKSLPKRDRPDLAAEFEFLKTMDPALGRPAKERLLDLMDFLEQAPETYAVPGDASSPWVERGPSNVGGRTRALMFDPNDPNAKKVWAAGVSGGIWYNNDITDPSVGWRKVDDFWDNMHVGALAFDPSNPQIFYAGTGEFAGSSSASSGGGIWKSGDGGQTWQRLPSTTPGARLDGGAGSDWHYVARLAVAPNGDVYAGTRGVYTNRGGLYRSQDGGNSWEKVLTRNTGREWVLDVEAEPSGAIYAAFSYPAALYKSTDQGETWTEIFSNGEAGRLEFSVNDTDSTIYALGAASSPSGSDDMAWIKKQVGGTDTWEDLPIPLEVASGNHFTRGQAWYDLIVESRPDEPNTVIIGGISLHRSLDGGQDWDSLTAWHPYYGDLYGIPSAHADQHNIVFRPGHPDEAIFSNDGGVYYSADVGDAAVVKPDFINRNTDFNVTQFYAVAMHPGENVDYYLGGTQDNGTQLFFKEGVNATIEVTGGDGAFCFIDEDDPNLQITSYIYNSYWVTTDGWQSYDRIVDVFEGRFINPCDYDSKTNTLYAAYDDAQFAYYKGVEDNPAQSFFPLDQGSTASAFKHYRNEGDSSYLFVGTGSGRLFRIFNIDDPLNSVTEEITGSSFPSGYISCVEVGKDQAELTVIFSNYGVSSVWHTKDGGQNWTAKEGNLPDMPIRWAVFNPLNREEMLLATELGVWSTQNFQDDTPTWAQSNNGFSNTRVDMLKVRKSDYQVVAATHGRGFFSNNAFNTIAVAGPGIELKGDLAMGNQWEGAYINREFVIENVGDQPLLVDSIAVPQGFKVDWQEGEIPVGQEKTVKLSFELFDGGVYQGDITVLSNAASGAGNIAYSLTLDTLEVNFGRTDITCFGADDGITTVDVVNYRGEILLSIDSVNFSADTLFDGLAQQQYDLYLKSEEDSFFTTRQFWILEPDSLHASVAESLQPTCSNLENGQLTAAALGGRMPYQYSLDGTNFRDGNLFDTLAAGSYELTVKDASGCVATVAFELENANQAPDVPEVLVAAGFEGISDILTLESSVTADSYQWYLRGETINGATGKTYEVQPGDFTGGPGSFQVEAITAAGCSEISAIQSITAADLVFATNEMAVFPNPVAKSLTVDLRDLGINSQDYQLQLFDLSGKAIFESALPPSGKMQIDMAGQPDGMYLLKLINGQKVMARKVRKSSK